MTVDRFAELYLHAPCGLLTTSFEDEIVDVNETLLGWTGYSREDLVGQPFSSMLETGSRVFYETRHRAVLHLQREVTEVALILSRADGTTMPVLVNSIIRDAGGGVAEVRTAIFDATARQEYERDLLAARRSAEASEARVRALQDISSAFGMSVSETDVAQAFVDVARDAFGATNASVLLLDDAGELQLAAGVNPLLGRVPPIASLRTTPVVTVINVDDAATEFPELAEGLREARLESLSITPLLYEQDRLGILVCGFARRGEFDDQFFDLQKALGRQASQTIVRVRLQRRLEQLALYDTLTGVANRTLLQQNLADAIGGAAEFGNPLAVIFVDLDGFKAVNDELGHVAGDAVLREVAQRIRAGVRSHDLVGRMGGDEFVAICENADSESAGSIAERIRLLIRQPIPGLPERVTVSASIGVVTYSPESDTRPSNDDLLNRADDAMYRSKGTGKDKVTLVG